jgi:hypothetical protein
LCLLQPYLRDKWKICDSCGVNNLHGMPSLLGITSKQNTLAFNHAHYGKLQLVRKFRPLKGLCHEMNISFWLKMINRYFRYMRFTMFFLVDEINLSQSFSLLL